MIIHKVIVHVLDKTNETPILNDFESRTSQEIEAFFQKAIKKVLNDDHLRKAVFKDYNENIIRKCCDNMIYYQDTFVENSQEIASYMFDVMKTSPEFESCDIAICLFSHEDEKFVGIFKMDYKKLFTHSIEFIEDKFNIQMVRNDVGIQESQRFKNAAIIGVSGVNDEYHLNILDKEAEKKGEPSIWITEFLKAVNIADEKFNTRMFKQITDNWLTNKFSTDIKQSEGIRSYMNHILKKEDEIDIEKFAEKTLDDEKLKEEFNDIMKEREVDPNFSIDKKWVSKNLKKKAIATDNGFNIRGNLDDFEDPMKYSIVQNKDGSFDIIIKNVSSFEVK